MELPYSWLAKVLKDAAGRFEKLSKKEQDLLMQQSRNVQEMTRFSPEWNIEKINEDKIYEINRKIDEVKRKINDTKKNLYRLHEELDSLMRGDM